MAYRRLLPTQAHLQECFDYNPETGSLVWRVRPLSHFVSSQRHKIWNKCFAGKEAGHVIRQKNGYMTHVVHVNGKLWIKARIIYKLVHNVEPKSVDHVDTDPENNRAYNLRDSTESQNAINRNRRSDSKSGYKGVCVISARKSKKYKATICLQGHVRHLGYFETPEEAYAVYCEAALLTHGEFVRLS